MAGILFQKFLNYGAHLILILFSLVALVYLFGIGQHVNMFYGPIMLIIFLPILIFVVIAINKKYGWVIKKLSFVYIFFERSFKNKKEFTNYLIKRYENFL